MLRAHFPRSSQSERKFHVLGSRRKKIIPECVQREKIDMGVLGKSVREKDRIEREPVNAVKSVGS